MSGLTEILPPTHDLPGSYPQYAAVLLLTRDNDIILQVRDGNGTSPHCLSLFAGALEGNETPRQGAARELEEETTLNVDLEFFMTYRAFVARLDSMAESHVFIARDVDPSDIKIMEGEGSHIIRSRAELDEHPVSTVSRGILDAYFASLS